MKLSKQLNKSPQLPNPTSSEILSLRKKKGLSQTEVGNFLNVTRAAVSAYEKEIFRMPGAKWVQLQEITSKLPDFIPRMPVENPNNNKTSRPRPSRQEFQALRIKKGLSCQDAALLLNLKIPSIYGYENGYSKIPFARWREFKEKTASLPDK